MMNDFESLRVVHDFYMPSSFRSFLLMRSSFSSAVCPLFANIADLYGLWAGIFYSVLCSVMLITLNHIIHDATYPFDGLGIDDLSVDLIEEAPLHMWGEKIVSNSIVQ